MAVPVHADRLVARNGLDQLDLVGLVIVLIELHRARAIPDFGLYLVAGGDDLAHLLFDGLEIGVGKRLLPVEIVVPAVVDHRANGDLHVRPQLLHRAGHDVGAVVADKLQHLRLVLTVRPHGQDGKLGVGLNGLGKVCDPPVDPAGERRLAERGADVRRDLRAGHARRIRPLRAVGQSDRDVRGAVRHGSILSERGLISGGAKSSRGLGKSMRDMAGVLCGARGGENPLSYRFRAGSLRR